MVKNTFRYIGRLFDKNASIKNNILIAGLTLSRKVMNTTSRVDFLFYVSIFLLFSHNYFVKSIPFNLLNRNNLKHINNIREGEINNFKSPMANTEKRLFVWSDVLSFPSKRDMQQRTIERKGQMEDNSIGTVIAQFLRDFSRTFHMIGDVIGTIFKQKKAEDINNL